MKSSWKCNHVYERNVVGTYIVHIIYIQLCFSEFERDVHNHRTPKRMEETASNDVDGNTTSNPQNEELEKPNAKK